MGLGTEDVETEKTSIAYRVLEHVKMGPKLSETLKGKVRLGARIIQLGGRENIFKEVFRVSEGEKLLKASQCYLSMTSGPIAGILFISTKKVAFYSDRSITSPSCNGDLIREPYKGIFGTHGTAQTAPLPHGIRPMPYGWR
ncbi:GEM-like protein 4 [Tanacetum coccineum]